MKKKFIAFLLFLCFIVTTSSLAVKAESTVKDTGTFYNEAKLKATSGTNLTESNYSTFFTNGKNFVTTIATSGTVQYDKNGGLTMGASKVPGTVTFTLAEEVNVVNIYGTTYDSGSTLTVNGTNATTGTIAAKGTKLDAITEPMVWNLDTATNKIAVASTVKRATIYKIEFAADTTEKTTYDVKFDINGGTFVEGKGTTITTDIGTATTGNLPTAEDVNAPYKYSILKGWKCGENVLEPGAAFEVSENTTYTAVYEAPEKISVEQAVEIAKLVGTTATTIEFNVEGEFVEKDAKGNFYIKDLTTDTRFSMYSPKTKDELYAGDVVIGTGFIKTYGKIYEFDRNCSYKIVTAKATSEFVKNETKTSLKVEYVTDETDSIYDVDIRFGGIISEASYRSDAKYGVIISSTEISYTAGELNFASVDDFLLEQMEANKNIHNLECTPVSVEGGYQFAWVIDNTEGHYNDTLYAVMYMEYNGKLYLCASKSASVVSAANDYVARSEELNLSALDVEILNKIANVK